MLQLVQATIDVEKKNKDKDEKFNPVVSHDLSKSAAAKAGLQNKWFRHDFSIRVYIYIYIYR